MFRCLFVALATLTSTSTVTGISVESAKEAELPAAEGNHRAARFGVQDRTTTVFVYTSTTTYTSTITPTCYTTDLLVLGRACTIKTILGVVQVGGKKRRKRSEDVVETRPVVSVDGVEVDYDELIKPHKTTKAEAEKRKEVEWARSESVRERELEIHGLPESCIEDPVVEGRFLSNFLTFLSRVTSTTISTSVASTTFSLTARVTFKGCTPTDVTTIFPTSC